MGLYLAKREREPEYNGKSLTEWLLLYERSPGAESDPRSYYDPAALQAAEHAVRQIGTNALPWLLKWIQCEPSSTGWRDKLAVVIDKLPGGLNDTSFVSSALRDRSDLREAVAFEAFRILGTNACSMAPELTRLMNESK